MGNVLSLKTLIAAAIVIATAFSWVGRAACADDQGKESPAVRTSGVNREEAMLSRPAIPNVALSIAASMQY